MNVCGVVFDRVWCLYCTVSVMVGGVCGRVVARLGWGCGGGGVEYEP